MCKEEQDRVGAFISSEFGFEQKKISVVDCRYTSAGEIRYVLFRVGKYAYRVVKCSGGYDICSITI